MNSEAQSPKASLAQLSIPVGGRVQIQAVQLVDSILHIEQPLVKTPPPKVEQRLRVKYKTDKQKSIFVRVRFMFHASDDDAPANKAVIEAEFFLAYAMASFEGIEDANIDAFARFNGVYNCWPYWREYLQSSLVRLGLPAVTLPVMTPSALEHLFDTQEEPAENAATLEGPDAKS